MVQTTENTTITHKQEAFLLKLLTSATMQAACDECSMSYETARRWMLQPAVQSRFAEMKRQFVDDSLAELVRHTSSAVAVISEIMSNREEQGSTRLRAASLVLEMTIQLQKTAALEKDYEELRRLLKERNV